MSRGAKTAEHALGGVGVLGGTFDPVHVGHLRAAEEVLQALGLERILFVPSAQPPHKSGIANRPVASAEDRLAWLQLAVTANPRFEVDPIEIERGGTSFFVDTLRSLRSRFAGRPPTFLIGRDAFALIASWREPDALFELAHFAVMTRLPHSGQTLRHWIPEAFRDYFEFSRDGRSGRHRTADTSIHQVDIPALDISSSAIRDAIAGGRSVRYWIPEAVYHAVRESRLYEEASGEALEHRRVERAVVAGEPLGRVEKARAALDAALSLRAEDPVVLDVRNVASFADTFMVLSGRSDRQVRSISDQIALSLRAAGERALGIEGYEEGHWILMDFTDLIVHVFLPEVRERYDLERLWSDATRIDLGTPPIVNHAVGTP